MLRLMPAPVDRSKQLLDEADRSGEGGSPDVGAESGVVEDNLLRRIDRRYRRGHARSGTSYRCSLIRCSGRAPPS